MLMVQKNMLNCYIQKLEGKMRVIIYATAATEGGALSVLNDLLHHIDGDGNSYIVCVNIELENKLPKINNVIYRYIDTKRFWKRIYLDFIGFNHLINKESNDIIINLQNIPVRTKLKQIVFIHQPIPFSNIKLSFLERNERKLFLYKYIYGYLIKLNQSFISHCLVQTEWMKLAVCNYLHLSPEKITIVKPKINVDDKYVRKNHAISNLFIYPAASYSYKNHRVLVESINSLDRNFLANHNFLMTFTINESDDVELSSLVNKYNLNEFVKFSGALPRNEVLQRLSESKALLFPSKLETFGIPLVEAAKMGVNIIASDLPYSKEVLSGYNKVIFCDQNSISHWSNAIAKMVESDSNHTDCGSAFKMKSGWDELDSILENLK
ncbi:glycosyltransferase [Enterobacter ludwigii]